MLMWKWEKQEQSVNITFPGLPCDHHHVTDIPPTHPHGCLATNNIDSPTTSVPSSGIYLSSNTTKTNSTCDLSLVSYLRVTRYSIVSKVEQLASLQHGFPRCIAATKKLYLCRHRICQYLTTRMAHKPHQRTRRWSGKHCASTLQLRTMKTAALASIMTIDLCFKQGSWL